MILYNVTVNIDKDVEQDWINWMKNTHIPEGPPYRYEKLCGCGFLGGNHNLGLKVSGLPQKPREYTKGCGCVFLTFGPFKKSKPNNFWFSKGSPIAAKKCPARRPLLLLITLLMLFTPLPTQCQLYYK